MNFKIMIQGDNFDYTSAVYLSTSSGVYVNSITGLTENDLFSAKANLSALFPAFSGFNINNLSANGTVASHGYTVISNNLLEVKLPTVENAGFIDIIVVNPAGYNTLMTSLTTTIRIY